MKTLMEMLSRDPRISGWKINMDQKESFELFFVKGKLETVRCTDTCDKKVTVYADHGQYKGDSQFFVYPSTTEAQLKDLVDEAVEKALLINNPDYALPQGETGEYTVESNFSQYAPGELAKKISKTVFAANTLENASLNSVEVFVNRYTETVRNSNGLHKTQTRYGAMVEAIPTYNGESQSVELYEQYNFSAYDEESLLREIAGKLEEVKARYEAVKPDFPLDCDVILNRQELSSLFWNIASDLNFASQYTHSSLWHKGDAIQKNPQGDTVSITMRGQLEGSVRSTRFDSDGLSLGACRILDKGTAIAYYGGNRYGQYMGETPTGDLPCIQVDPGTAVKPDTPCLEIVSMSGLQVDFFSDYIGGEVRLAYYRSGETTIPVTGISISGKASQILETIRLSRDTCVSGSCQGPQWAVLKGMQIY